MTSKRKGTRNEHRQISVLEAAWWYGLTKGGKLPANGSVCVKLGLVVLMAACSPDLGQHTGIVEPGISTRLDVPASAIQLAALCNWDRSSRALSCASKDLSADQKSRTAHEIAWKFQSVTVRNERDEDKSLKWPAGLLPAIVGSIVTAVTFAGSRARYISKMESMPHQLFSLQTSQSLLIALITGLPATILLLILEAALRRLLWGGL